MAPLLVAEARGQKPLEAALVHEWRGGASSVRFFRHDSEYIVRFPRIADFHVGRDGRTARCHPVPGAPERIFWHLYRNQVAPLMRELRGCIVLHASAVEIEGRAVAFVGASGEGKSTLAAAFVAAGHRVLCDDALVLEPSAGEFWAQPCSPTLRLWQDSRKTLTGTTTTTKSAYVARTGVEHCETSCVLRRMYFLGGSTDAVAVEHLAGATVFMALLRHSFVLDPHDSRGGAERLDRLALLSNGVPSARLAFPRRYDRLHELRHRVLEHLA